MYDRLALNKGLSWGSQKCRRGEGGQEEEKEVALIGSHLHKKQEESMETVHLVRHNSNCQLHSTMGPGKETSTKLLFSLHKVLF